MIDTEMRSCTHGKTSDWLTDCFSIGTKHYHFMNSKTAASLQVMKYFIYIE